MVKLDTLFDYDKFHKNAQLEEHQRLKMSRKEIYWKKFDHEIQESIDEIIDAVDKNGNGIVTMNEFIQNTKIVC